MNSKILNTEVQTFIAEHLDAEISRLVFKGSPFQGITIQELIEQIESKRKCQTKLPTWFKTSGIYYPNKLNIEQTSSEITANYKSKLISGVSLIDITGGFGVDTFYFSRQFQTVTHCEINLDLSSSVSHNFKTFGIANIRCIAQNGIDYLMSEGQTYDWIFIDPSRRHESKGKVFMLKDCLPNVPKHLNTLFTFADHILIKTSPLLDISLGLTELEHVFNIQVIAVNNEVKELLWMLKKDCEKDISITTVNIRKDINEVFIFSRETEKTLNLECSEPLRYLYEPNAAILKSGGFQSVAKSYPVNKMHQHTHLYTSDALIDFPGRAFQIDKKLIYNKKNMRALSISQANVTTRNFPVSVQDLRKKHRIRDGGNHYMFFTTNHLDQRIVLLCSKCS